jgi:hypothetical protein
MSGISLEDFVAVFDESLDLKNRQLQNNEAK